MKRPRVISLFAGMGGFDLACQSVGMKIVAQVECDQNCSRVLAHHWPKMKRHTDVREFQGRHGSADVVCGGWPCQGNSLAGRRGGMDDPRSGLFRELCRVADETSARVVFGENVPGVLSVRRGQDWSTVLEMLTGYRPQRPRDGWRNSGVCIGPKRSAAWCVLDAQYFGLPQRRNRVFLVADRRRGAYPAEVLFESESCDGDSPPSRESESQIAYALQAKTRSGSKVGQAWNTTLVYGSTNVNGTPIAAAAATIRCGQRGGACDNRDTLIVYGSNNPEGTPAAAAAAAVNAGGGRRLDYQTETFIAYGTVTEGFKPDYVVDALHGPTGNKEPLIDGIRRLTPLERLRCQGFPDDWCDGCDVSPTAIETMTGNAVAVPVVEWIAGRLMAFAGK